MQPDLTEQILELVRLTSTDLPPDVEEKLRKSKEQEDEGSAAEGALNTILKNVEMARENSTPICQDTGTPIFYVSYPEGWSTRKLSAQIKGAVIEATAQTYLRPNSVNTVTGKNTGDNSGDEHYPSIHFQEVEGDKLTIDLMLKGGGCENEIEDHPSPPPKRYYCENWMTKTPIRPFLNWKKRSPARLMSWILVLWDSGGKPQFWAQRLRICTVCLPVILSLYPICVGLFDDDR